MGSLDHVDYLPGTYFFHCFFICFFINHRVFDFYDLFIYIFPGGGISFYYYHHANAQSAGEAAEGYGRCGTELHVCGLRCFFQEIRKAPRSHEGHEGTQRKRRNKEVRRNQWGRMTEAT